eukprot:CAMPEP_0114279522 /NCGR_PEP_ID=MMETSP0059-20121206/1930_1 /TAXON_ID=36894 /ORGANISM="Pyramimonas parkeae, Strain CCMP726" /LENGTH=42 /DNA_ID= /DNA_START= /DNA_END= /DNA_ORIENTATION=
MSKRRCTSSATWHGALALRDFKQQQQQRTQVADVVQNTWLAE